MAVFYLPLGPRSLHDHARPVAAALSAGDEAEARRLVSLIVSRDPASLDIARAATELVLEHGNDAAFGALFRFVVAGAPGVVIYRLANTLDAMRGSATSVMSISALRRRARPGRSALAGGRTRPTRAPERAARRVAGAL